MAGSPYIYSVFSFSSALFLLIRTSSLQHLQQRDNLAGYISQNECSYLKSLLSLFPAAEARGDYGSLATLAACVKTVLLLNDPPIIELVVTDESAFEDVCATLEYDPDLRDKANHRWFLRERAKFRTVALMEDEDLIAAIHRSFRVNYLRDTLLRPTMDESSLSTLSSLQTFTHSDVVKGVTMSPAGTDEDTGELLKDSYLAKVIRILGRESNAVCELEWRALEKGADSHSLIASRQQESASDPSTVVASGRYSQSPRMSTIWGQHLAPQDDSLASRRLRRRGSLSFLRELFNMVRISLQQNDKDDFFAVLVAMEVNLAFDRDLHSQEDGPSAERSRSSNDSGAVAATVEGFNEPTDAADNGTNHESSLRFPSKPVNLLSILATVLSDPETDVTEKGSVLEIIAGIAMHDPSLIRRKCLDFYVGWKKSRRSGDLSIDTSGPTRPKPNEKRQIIFQCPENDLLASFMFLLATETDAGVLLQVSEIMRIILDTDMIGDHGPINTGFADEAEGIPPSGGHNPPHDQHPNPTGSGNPTSTELNKFLSMFYEHYIQWLSAPFQYTIFYPLIRFPRAYLAGETKSPLIERMKEKFEKGGCNDDPMLHKVPFCALRNSFVVELLSFCVRAHVYRMKVYLLRSRVLGNVLKLLKPSSLSRSTSGDRCLKLAALRFLRSILSVNESMYHKHIIQHDLFGPVFEAFRANPVGDNLVSSSIVEMCDFITSEHINSLIEYIVTKHLAVTSEAHVPSLEDFSTPYVSTLTALREAHEKHMEKREGGGRYQVCDQKSGGDNSELGDEAHSRYFHNHPGVRSRVVMSEKAMEDQRKFREIDQDESYFESDDDEGTESNTATSPTVDELEVQQGVEKELHRTPRMFSLPQGPLGRNIQLRIDETNHSEIAVNRYTNSQRKEG
jgi:Component of IIS longevity pathway SMK-1